MPESIRPIKHRLRELGVEVERRERLAGVEATTLSAALAEIFERLAVVEASVTALAADVHRRLPPGV